MADANMRIIISALNKTQEAFKQIKDDMNGLKSSAGGLNDATKTFSLNLATIGKVAAGVTATIMAIKKAYDFTEEGASMLTTMQTATSIAATYGQNMKEIVESVRTASLDTVSEYDATLAVSQALMFGLQGNAEQFGNLMEIAAFRGRAFGLTATQAFSDIVRGIGRLSPLILDNIGITIDANNTYEQYAESIGKATSELSSVEKRQALLNRVLEEGNRLMQEAGGLTYSTSTALERINTKWKDFWNTIKEGTAEAILPFISTEEEVSEYYNAINTNLEKTDATYAEYVENRRKQFAQLGYYIDEEGALYRRSYSYFAGALQIRNELIATNALLTQSNWEARQAMEEGVSAPDIEVRRIELMAAANNELKFTISEVNHELALSAGLSQELADAQEDYFAAIATGGTKAENAIGTLSDNINKFIFDTVQATDMLGVTATTSLGFALGQIDEKSWTVGLAIEQLTQRMDINQSGMIDSEQEAKYLSDAMQILAQNANEAIKDRHATWTVDMLISGISSTSPTNISYGYRPGKVGGYFSVQRPNIPGLQFGGSVNSGSPYLVGEAGPELFVPQDNGRILANDNLGIGGKNITINIKYAPTVSTASESEVQWILKPMIQRALREM